MSYIEREAAIKHLRGECVAKYPASFYLGLLAAADEISKQPTADVVEVVRCKDCKHNVANWQHDELDIEDYTDIVCDYFMTDGMEANDYCSHGERRENET